MLPPVLLRSFSRSACGASNRLAGSGCGLLRRSASGLSTTTGRSPGRTLAKPMWCSRGARRDAGVAHRGKVQVRDRVGGGT
jgi:hypothetical protein